jgi:hypothetical protein
MIMKLLKLRRFLVVLLSFFYLNCESSMGVVLYGSGDPEKNTTAPQGELAGSGWELEGTWGSFLGTPIAPNYFVTAHHVGGSVGDEFWIDGVRHVTVAQYVDSGSDLAIWAVYPRFSKWAELYNTNSEVGKRLVVIGRGTQRGGAVQVNGLLGPVIKGWLWGPWDGRKRWGENVVESIFDADGNPGSIVMSGVVAVGSFLRVTFDPDAGANEAHLTGGDSAGAVFVNDGGGWKLAGINLGVDGPYNTSNSGPGFYATIFDEGGLYKMSQNNWVLTPELPSSQAGAFYATRISGRIQWIQSVISQPVVEPQPVLQWTSGLNEVFTDDSSADFDTANLVVKTSLPSERRFFRLRGFGTMEITSMSREGDSLVLHYQYK